MRAALPPAAQQGPVASRTEAWLGCQPADARARSGEGRVAMRRCPRPSGPACTRRLGLVRHAGGWRVRLATQQRGLTSGDKRRPQSRNAPYSSEGSRPGSAMCHTSPVRLRAGCSGTSCVVRPAARSASVNRHSATLRALAENSAKLVTPCAGFSLSRLALPARRVCSWPALRPPAAAPRVARGRAPRPAAAWPPSARGRRRRRPVQRLARGLPRRLRLARGQAGGQQQRRPGCSGQRRGNQCSLRTPPEVSAGVHARAPAPAQTPAERA